MNVLRLASVSRRVDRLDLEELGLVGHEHHALTGLGVVDSGLHRSLLLK
jgi:hypothetical protein